MQVARRRLEVVAGVQRHGLAIRPPERFSIEAKKVLEVTGVEMRADSAARSAFSDDEQELPARVGIAREEGIAAEPLATAIREHVRARRQRQLLVADANGRGCRRRSWRQLEVAGRRGTRQRSRRNFSRDAGGDLRPVVPFAHRGERRADTVVHREQGDLRAVGSHRPAVRRSGRQVGEVAAHHRPALAAKLEFHFAAQDEHGRVAAQMRMPRHRRTRVAGEGRELVNVAGIRRSRDAFHGVAADAVELSGVSGQNVHAFLPGQLAHDRLGVGAADFDGVEDLVGDADQLGLREQTARAESVPSSEPAASSDRCGADEPSSIPLFHRYLLGSSRCHATRERSLAPRAR